MSMNTATTYESTDQRRQLMTAKFARCDAEGRLVVNDGPRPIQMCHSDGTGEPLFTWNGFGADVIRFAANEGVKNHTHEGDHILFVLSGRGIVEFDKVDYSLYPGVAYFVPGSVDHAIRAHENLVLIAVGNNHRPLDSEARMSPLFPVNQSDRQQ